MTTHGPFQLEKWWDGDRGRYNCIVRLGTMSVVEHDSFDGGPVGAEFLAWRTMACRLAQLRENAVELLTPMNFNLEG